MSQVDRSQAHYLARSGAETFAQYIVNASTKLEYNEMNDLLNSIIDKPSAETGISNGKVSIEVKNVNSNGIEVLRIISRAQFKSATSESSVDLKFKRTAGGGNTVPSFSSEAIVIVSDNSGVPMKITNGKITGDVYINMTADNSIYLAGGENSVTGGDFYIPAGTNIQNLTNVGYGTYSTFIKTPIKQYNNTLSYPIPKLPSLPVLEKRTNVTVSGSDTKTISASGLFDKISIESNTTLKIDLKNSEMEIRVKDLSVSGKIEIINAGTNGKLKLYVENSLALNYGHINYNNSPDALTLYYLGGSNLKIASDFKLNGNIFINSSDLIISGGAQIKGSIVALSKNVTLSGGSLVLNSMIYAPNAKIFATGSGTVNGTVLAKSLDMSGGSRFNYTTTDFNYPDGVFEGGESSIEIDFGNSPWN